MRRRALDPFEFRLMREIRTLESHLGQGPDHGTVPFFVLVSGGKDSMALLHALKAVFFCPMFAGNTGFTLHALHFNHLTRNGESCRDARFVRKFCMQSGIPIRIITRTTAIEKNIKDKRPFQALASDWRKHNCRQINEKYLGNAIFVTAHHAKDQAENLLLNLTRGAGLNGLRGMAFWDKSTRFFKPLLKCPSEDILRYINEHNIEHIHDSSNASEHYSRNFIRHQVFPLLEKLNPNLERTLSNLSEEAASWSADTTQLPPKLPLTLWAKMGSTSLLYHWMSQHHETLLRKIGRQSLANLADHLDHWVKQSVKGRALLTPFVPLGAGWLARLEEQELEIVRSIESHEDQDRNTTS